MTPSAVAPSMVLICFVAAAVFLQLAFVWGLSLARADAFREM